MFAFRQKKCCLYLSYELIARLSSRERSLKRSLAFGALRTAFDVPKVPGRTETCNVFFFFFLVFWENHSHGGATVFVRTGKPSVASLFIARTCRSPSRPPGRSPAVLYSRYLMDPGRSTPRVCVHGSRCRRCGRWQPACASSRAAARQGGVGGAMGGGQPMLDPGGVITVAVGVGKQPLQV